MVLSSSVSKTSPNAWKPEESTPCALSRNLNRTAVGLSQPPRITHATVGSMDGRDRPGHDVGIRGIETTSRRFPPVMLALFHFFDDLADERIEIVRRAARDDAVVDPHLPVK